MPAGVLTRRFIGERIGQLVLLRVEGVGKKARRYVCQCDCGNVSINRSFGATLGARSCGCGVRKALTPQHIAKLHAESEARCARQRIITAIVRFLRDASKPIRTKDRVCEMLTMRARGATNAEIATKIGGSTQAVYHHIGAGYARCAWCRQAFDAKTAVDCSICQACRRRDDESTKRIAAALREDGLKSSEIARVLLRSRVTIARLIGPDPNRCGICETDLRPVRDAGWHCPTCNPMRPVYVAMDRLTKLLNEGAENEGNEHRADHGRSMDRL